MADPVSITGLVLQVGVLLKQLVEYGRAVKGAQGEIGRLRTELYALKGVLRDIESAQEDAGKRPLKRELSETLTTASALFGELAHKLDGTRHRKVKSLVWPFEKPECNEILGRLERVKTWLMLYSMGEQQAGIVLIQDSLRSLTVTVQDDIADRKARLRDDEEQALLNLLKSPSSDAVHVKACSAWQGTTPGFWFINGYLKPWIWDDRPTARLLLLNGKSGSGKTILMSRAAECMTAIDIRGSALLAAKFYCTYSDDTAQDVTSVLGALVAQLAVHRPSLLDLLDPKPTKGKQSSIAQLESCVIAAAADSRVVLLVDALNESSGRSAILQSLSRLAENIDGIRILASSTLGSSVLDHQHGPFMQVDMATGQFTPDMVHFIDNSIAHSKILQRLSREIIHTALLNNADGSFRWLELQVQSISTQPTARRALQAMQNTPQTLDDTYAATLSRVPVESRDLVKETIAWVAFAHRPLGLDELSEAVVIEDGQRNIDDTYRIAPPNLLLALCQGLLSVDPVIYTVTFAHQSVWTYLTTDASKRAEDSFWHLDEDYWMRCIVRKCLTYLLMEPFSYGRALIHRREALHALYPLLDFSSTRWALYAANVHLGSEELELAKELFLTHRRMKFGGNFAFWIAVLLSPTEHDNAEVTKRAEPLYYAASYGCLQLVTMLVGDNLVARSTAPGDTRWHIDHRCGHYLSPALQVACYRGYLDVAEILLKAGADFDIDDVEGYNCLDWARINADMDCIKLLQSYGAREVIDPDSEPHAKPRESFNGSGDRATQFANRDRREWRSLTVPYEGFLAFY
ncbi:hypothetical protein LTR95_013828 [Oleoguttula sp. CCFEE 5521]